MNDEGTVKPVATADVHLSEDDRKRIAAELGLTDEQYEAVPEKLSIARYAEEDIGGDVGAFLNGQLGSPDLNDESTFATATQVQMIGTPRLSAARIPGSILVPV